MLSTESMLTLMSMKDTGKYYRNATIGVNKGHKLKTELKLIHLLNLKPVWIKV